MTPVRLGFASFKNGEFELIVRRDETGEEITLHGRLLPEQNLKDLDSLLPTCVFVDGSATTLQSELTRAREREKELTASVHDLLRMLEAVRLSAGLGKKQIERMERALALAGGKP